MAEILPGMYEIGGQLLTLQESMPSDLGLGYFCIAAVGNTILDDDAMKGVLELRASRYLERGYIDESHIDDWGREIPDEEDGRSVHVAYVAGGSVAATMRLIVRGDEPLPVERIFPEVGETMHPRSMEVSRFIADHPDKKLQTSITRELSAVAFKVTIENQLDPYMVVERPFATFLKLLGVSLVRLNEGRVLGEYNDTFNVAYLVNVPASLKLVEDRDERNTSNIASIWKRFISADDWMRVVRVDGACV